MFTRIAVLGVCVLLTGCGQPSDEMVRLCAGSLSTNTSVAEVDLASGKAQFPTPGEMLSGDRRVSFLVKIRGSNVFDREAMCTLSKERGVKIEYLLKF